MNTLYDYSALQNQAITHVHKSFVLLKRRATPDDHLPALYMCASPCETVSVDFFHFPPPVTATKNKYALVNSETVSNTVKEADFLPLKLSKTSILSQQAATGGALGARPQHIKTDRTLRECTREALLASVPDANIPERHDATYDHMAKWTQQRELGTIARYELTQGIVSPLAIRHNEREAGLPVAAQSLPHAGTTSPIFTPSTSPVSTPHPGSSSISQQASFTSISTATTETSATDNSTTIDYPPDYLPTKPSTPLSIRGFVSIVNGQATVLPASTLQLHSVPGSPARLGEVEYPTTPRPSTPRSIRRGFISMVNGQATVLPGSRLGLHTVPDSPAQSDEAASAQQHSGPADSTTKLKGKANRLVDKVRSSVRRHVNGEPSFIVERKW